MLYIDHLSNLCLEWEPQSLREIQLDLSVKKRRRETAGRIRWQFNTRAGPVFALARLEVGNCTCHGELGSRETSWPWVWRLICILFFATV